MLRFLSLNCSDKEKALQPENLVTAAFSAMVPVAGLEPAHCCQRRILSPLRLPISSHRHDAFVNALYYTTGKKGIQV